MAAEGTGEDPEKKIRTKLVPIKLMQKATDTLSTLSSIHEKPLRVQFLYSLPPKELL